MSHVCECASVFFVKEAFADPDVAKMERWGDRADAADVELALLRDGSAVILQARPYRMRRDAR